MLHPTLPTNMPYFNSGSTFAVRIVQCLTKLKTREDVSHSVWLANCATERDSLTLPLFSSIARASSKSWEILNRKIFSTLNYENISVNTFFKVAIWTVNIYPSHDCDSSVLSNIVGSYLIWVRFPLGSLIW